MINIFRLIYISILRIFSVPKEELGDNHIPPKLLFTGVIIYLYGCLIYFLSSKINFVSVNYCFLFWSFLATCLSLVFTIFYTKSMLYQKDDLFFSLPLERKEILGSRFLLLYLKNLALILVIMVTIFIYSINTFENISNLLCLIYILLSLALPLIPMSIGILLFSFITNIKKNKLNIKNLMILICTLFFITIMLKVIPNKNKVWLYPLNYLFYITIKEESVLFLIMYILSQVILSILVFQKFDKNFINVYEFINSQKNSPDFYSLKYKKRNKLFGSVRKDLYIIFQGKGNIRKIFILSCCTTFFYLMFLILFSSKISISLLPILLVSITSITIIGPYLINEEKQTLSMELSYPKHFLSLYFSKLLTSILIGGIFVLLNGIITLYCFNTSFTKGIFFFLLPTSILLFLNSIGIYISFITFDKKNNYYIYPFISGIFSLVFDMGTIFSNYFATDIVLHLSLTILCFIGALINMFMFIIFHNRIKNKISKQF